MRTERDLAAVLLRDAREQLTANVRSLTLAEALFAGGGYRSALGVLKHLGGWAHVYWSYAFEPEPRGFARTSWPRGLRDTVDLSEGYLREVVAWADEALDRWERSVLGAADPDAQRPLHWGARAPLGDVAVLVAQHVAYHTGELNMLLSIARGEAWEYTEEVEENHIPTAGHRVRPPWMTDEEAARHEPPGPTSRRRAAPRRRSAR